MRRRDFVGVVGGAAAATIWPRTSRAQPSSAKVFRIGFLGLPSADSLPKRTEAFRAGLRDLGYQAGRDIVIEYRWADSHYDRLPALLAELINLNVDVIVTHGTPGVTAAKQATSTIPIVIAVVGDAVASGLVASLARPAGIHRAYRRRGYGVAARGTGADGWKNLACRGSVRRRPCYLPRPTR